MAKRPNINDAAIQQKVKVLMKLRDNAVHSEKDLLNLSAEAMLLLPEITVREMGMIIELQKNVKTNHLFSYLIETMNITGPGPVPELISEDADPGKGGLSYEV